MTKDGAPRLRADPLDLAGQPPPFHLVLVDPEIPQNTGNAARLAGALKLPLHLVGTLGFRIDEKAVRRAGLDYWHLVDVRRHDDLEAFRAATPDCGRLLYFSAIAGQSYLDAGYRRGDALVFGKESSGLPDALLADHPDDCYAVPTIGAVRSLNLANTVAVVAYEAMRQLGALSRVVLR